MAEEGFHTAIVSGQIVMVVALEAFIVQWTIARQADLVTRLAYGRSVGISCVVGSAVTVCMIGPSGVSYGSVRWEILIWTWLVAAIVQEELILSARFWQWQKNTVRSALKVKWQYQLYKALLHQTWNCSMRTMTIVNYTMVIHIQWHRISNTLSHFGKTIR